MKKYTFTFLTFLFFLQTAQGQNLKKITENQIEIGLGHQKNYLKDHNLSPLNQVGNGLAAMLKYIRRAENIFGFNFQFSSGTINSGPSNQFTTSYINASLELEYLFKLTAEEKSYQFFLGPAYNSRVLFLDWRDLEAFSYVASHGIGVKGQVSKKIDENHLVQASLSLPIFQFLARPPYNGIDEFIIETQDRPAKILLSSRPSTFNDYLALEFGVDYKYKLTKRIDWHTNFTLYAQKVKEPSLLKSLSNAITTGIAINF